MKNEAFAEYEAVWYRYPHGVEGEPMDSNYKIFNSLEKAIGFIKRRSEIIGGIYWAGAEVRGINQDGNYLCTIYEITSDYTHIDYREQMVLSKPSLDSLIANAETQKSEPNNSGKEKEIKLER